MTRPAATVRKPMLLPGLAAGLALSAPAASADLDDVLARIPADAPTYIAVKDTRSLVTNLQSFLASAGQAEAGLAVASAGNGIIATPGLGSGAAAIVITDTFRIEAGEEPELVILVELENFDQAMRSLAGEREDGAFRINLFGETAFARDLGGGVAVFAETADDATGFEPGEGLTRAHRARLGEIGGMLFDNDLVVVTHIPRVADGLKGLVSVARQQVAGIAMMAGPQGAVLTEDELWAPAGIFLEQAEATAIGLSYTSELVTVDIAAHFKDNSTIAGFFQDSGSTEGLLERLPDGPFLFASATDTRSKGLRNLQETVAAFGEQINEAVGQGGAGQPPELLPATGARGEAIVVGENPQGLMGGMMTRATRYVATDDGRGLMRGAADAAGDLADDPQTIGPFEVSANWQPDAYTSGDVSAARWSMTMLPAPGDPTAMQAQQGLQLMYGPTGGPAGFAGAVDGGIVQTFSAGNTGLFDQAVNAASRGNGLGTSDRLGAARKALPENRVLEAYVDVDTILGGILPLAQMFAGPLPFDAPGDLTPVGASITTAGGGVTIRAAVPADVVKWSIEAGQAVAEAEGGNLGGGGGGGGGAPRF